MAAIRATTRELFRDVAVGAGLGLLLLGVGGRIAMRVVALAIGQAPTLNAGGTLTVVAAGAAAGAVGALLRAVSGTAARAAARGRAVWVNALRLAFFAALLVLVTARGLSGSPGPTWPFWLLVAAYGCALEAATARFRRERFAL